MTLPQAQGKLTAVILMSLFFSLVAPFAQAQVITPPFTDTFSSLTGWTSEDIGDATTTEGSDTSVAGNELLLSGSGTRIGGDEDGFRYAYQKISGDFIAEVKISVLPTYQAGSAAGIMVRQTDDPTSDMAFIGVTRDNGTVFISRSGGTTTDDTGSAIKMGPLWLRLERRGEWVKGSFSLDDKTWFNNVGAKGFPSAVKIPLKDPVLLGLALTPANNTAIDIAHFATFTVTQPDAGTGGFAAKVKVKGAPPIDDGDPTWDTDGVYVRAVDDSGKEVAGAYVTGGTAVALSGVAPGTVKLQAVGSGYRSLEANVTVEAGKVAETSFEVAPSELLAPQGTIKGTITNAANVGQANVTVRAISTGASAIGPVFVSGKTNTKGVYTLTVPSGAYSVTRLSDARFVPVNDDVKPGIVVTENGSATADFKVETLPVESLLTANDYDWKIKLGPDVTVDEDHKALDDPETDFIDYEVKDGKSPWGVIDPTPRIYAWVRLKFKIPDSLKAFKGNDLRLYGFTFEDTDICYFNGVQIGSGGKHDETDVNNDKGFVSAWNLVRDYKIPAALVNWDGDNVIAFKGFVRNSTVENGGFSITSPPLLTAIQTLIPSVKKGDLNGDGKVNVLDATLALRFAVGLTTPSAQQLQAGALGDGKKITVADATKILRAAVGLIQL
jgi:regulation of enolase protein 1 (concanavalin A-like superfamily)